MIITFKWSSNVPHCSWNWSLYQTNDPSSLLIPKAKISSQIVKDKFFFYLIDSDTNTESGINCSIYLTDPDTHTVRDKLFYLPYWSQHTVRDNLFYLPYWSRQLGLYIQSLVWPFPMNCSEDLFLWKIIDVLMSLISRFTLNCSSNYDTNAV